MIFSLLWLKRDSPILRRVHTFSYDNSFTLGIGSDTWSFLLKNDIPKTNNVFYFIIQFIRFYCTHGPWEIIIWFLLRRMYSFVPEWNPTHLSKLVRSRLVSIHRIRTFRLPGLHVYPSIERPTNSIYESWPFIWDLEDRLIWSHGPTSWRRG